MTDLLNIAGEVVKELFRSDVGGHVPHWAYEWLAVVAAHIGMGMMVALSALRKSAAKLLALYVLKELCFDLRIDGYAVLTWADSAADAFALWFGFAWASRRCRTMLGCQPSTSQSDQSLAPSLAPKKWPSIPFEKQTRKSNARA